MCNESRGPWEAVHNAELREGARAEAAEAAAKAKEPRDGCSCMAWQDSFVKLTVPVLLPFHYCPWCGRGLTTVRNG